MVEISELKEMILEREVEYKKLISEGMKIEHPTDKDISKFSLKAETLANEMMALMEVSRMLKEKESRKDG